jgi:hypothetical protein
MYRKTRKNKRVKQLKTIKKPKKDEHEEVLDAITEFEYKTDYDQMFSSDHEKQQHLAKSIKSLRASIEKYIQKRSENLK